MNPEIANKLTQIDQRINGFNIPGTKPVDNQHLVAEINAIKTEIASWMKTQADTQKSFWDRISSRLQTIDHEIDSKNNQAS